MWNLIIFHILMRLENVFFFFKERSLWSVPDVSDYYKRNLRRFTHLIRTGELDRLIRPGKFSTYPVNNIEKILRFKDVHFEGILHAISHK